jgi:hypothetical protein
MLAVLELAMMVALVAFVVMVMLDVRECVKSLKPAPPKREITANDILRAKRENVKPFKLKKGWQDQARELESKHNTKAQQTQKRAEEFKKLGYE